MLAYGVIAEKPRGNMWGEPMVIDKK